MLEGLPHSFGRFSEIYWNIRDSHAAYLIADDFAEYASSGVNLIRHGRFRSCSSMYLPTEREAGMIYS